MKRRTSQRAALEMVFQKEDRPMGVEEILNAGRKIVRTLNQATVYRNLKIMVDNGELIQINHPAMGTLYERTGKGHHHHFYCRICGRVFELPGCGLDSKKAAPKGFITEEHEIFLFGVCPSCAK
ncbi:MAG: transcriptional repressor [Deltaproteobacteria bacterium]|nr:transcriptional repressor [Deltaproteobacteria bacterium]